MPSQAIACIFEPDASRRHDVVSAVASAGCDVRELTSVSAAADVADRIQADVAVFAVDGDAAADVLDAAARLRAGHPTLPIIVIVRGGSEAIAIAALRAGVADYLPAPIDRAALTAAVRRCLDARPQNGGAGGATRGRSSPRPHHPLIGSAQALRSVCEYLDRAAPTGATVLITGETGTGKELAARRVHDASGRAGRFVPVNCAAIPDALLESELFGYEAGTFTGATRAREGLLQAADRGTIFLDEIGEMGWLAQAKILRAIETREIYRVGARRATPIDVRVVAATNQNLDEALEAGRFRKDLYFRLNVARVHLPPLRERRCDIPSMIDHFLRTLHGGARTAVEFAPQTLEALVAYDWPGNVRELKNLIETLFVASPAGRLRVEDLPAGFRDRLARYCALPDAERARLMDALMTADWNKSRAAEMLHWSRMTLYRKMAKYSVVSSTPRSRLTTRR